MFSLSDSVKVLSEYLIGFKSNGPYSRVNARVVTIYKVA